MVSPIRKLLHHPNKILSPYIKSGMNILEIGPGMGYFSLPMAKLTGVKGMVYCIDIQQGMLDRLMKRANKQNIKNIETRLSNQTSFNIDTLKEQIDFAFLFAVVHEVPDQEKLFKQVGEVIKPGGKLFFAEPRGHVSVSQFEKSISIARNFGFTGTESSMVKGSHTIVLTKK